MSFRVMNQVMECCAEQGGERELLMTLAWRADDQGRNVWYDTERIAFESRMSIRSVQRHLAALLSAGRVVLDVGRGPQGGDLLHLNLPTVKFTREQWGGVREIRGRGKRRAAKTRRTPTDVSLSKDEPAPVNDKLAAIYRVHLSLLGDKLAVNFDKLTSENTLSYRPGVLFSAQYSPCTVLKNINTNVVVMYTSSAHAGEDATEVPDNLENNNNIFLEQFEKQTNEANADGWDACSLDQSLAELFSDSPDLPDMAPNGAAPNGASSSDEDDLPLWDNSLPVSDVKNTAVEKIPPAAAPLAIATPERVRAEPGTPVYDRLRALCGGSVKNPYLTTLLTEFTPGGNSRQRWLMLSLTEVEAANVQGRMEVQAGRATTWRGGFIFALDCLVDGIDAPKPAVLTESLPEAPQQTQETPAPDTRFMRAEPKMKLPSEQIPRPGAAGGPPRRCNFQAGMRVRLGERLGVVVSVTADACQASATVDFDDGDRLTLAGPTLAPLREVLDRETPPPPPTIAMNSSLPVGSLWRHKSSGQVLRLVSVYQGRPTTEDETGATHEWPAFGPGALTNQCEPLAAEADAGAA